ncbi:DUF6163 family protein [Jiella sp. M17.18]|uniref:DUF6163 family protein n=1 Tax=Jiella sp. M17.18 TaxID=3234247 RepID=UPI0034DF966A
MTIELSPREPGTGLIRRLTLWLYRLSAIVLFALGIACWIRLIGVERGPLARFDLMPVWWKLVMPPLAVVYPVAGMGLWMAAGWGAVLWVLIAIIEAVMHLGFPQLFGPDLVWLGFHAGGLIALAGLRIAAWRQTRPVRHP